MATVFWGFMYHYASFFACVNLALCGFHGWQIFGQPKKFRSFCDEILKSDKAFVARLRHETAELLTTLAEQPDMPYRLKAILQEQVRVHTAWARSTEDSLEKEL